MKEHIYKQHKTLIDKHIKRMLSRSAAPKAGPAPAYSDPFYWAAFPEKNSAANNLPSFLKGEAIRQTADLFYLHPTTYLSGINPLIMPTESTNKSQMLAKMRTAAWNANLEDEALNHLTDMRAVSNQATAFNAACRIFAPRYRQAHIKAFLAPDSNASQQAFNLAYQDVKEAFEYYLQHENDGRPIVIAAHSQGSMHAIRLLKEYFDGQPLQKQLVCAYIVGYELHDDLFTEIPFGETPQATGCFVGWCSYLHATLPSEKTANDANLLCINPLSWTTSTQPVGKEQNAGMLLSLNKLLAHEVGAQIEPNSQILWVSLSEFSSKVLKEMTNLHAFDYNLFWMDIRQNVRLRIEAYNHSKE